eukprot:Gb_20892 [translate_table: standard]
MKIRMYWHRHSDPVWSDDRSQFHRVPSDREAAVNLQAEPVDAPCHAHYALHKQFLGYSTPDGCRKPKWHGKNHTHHMPRVSKGYAAGARALHSIPPVWIDSEGNGLDPSFFDELGLVEEIIEMNSGSVRVHHTTKILLTGGRQMARLSMLGEDYLRSKSGGEKTQGVRF